MFPTVPESILKKRKRDEQWAAKATAAKAEAKKKAAAKKQEIFKRAEKYVAEYRSQASTDSLISIDSIHSQLPLGSSVQH